MQPAGAKKVYFPHNLRTKAAFLRELEESLTTIPANAWKGDFLKWYTEEVWRDHSLTKTFLSQKAKGAAVGSRHSEITGRVVIQTDKDIGMFNKSCMDRLSRLEKQELQQWYDRLEKRMLRKNA